MEKIGLKSINIGYLIGEINLKKDLLYFDKLAFDENELDLSISLSSKVGDTLLGEEKFKETLNFQRAELDYLQEKGLVEGFNSDALKKAAYEMNLKPFTDYYDSGTKSLMGHNGVLNLASVMEETARLFNWEEGNSNTIFRNYFFSELLNATSNQDSTPILDSFIPEKKTEIGKEYEVLEVVLKKFPIIDDSVSWEQLIDYKSDSDSKRKFLALRNWMIEISKGNYSSMEIGEKLDYLYAEYESHLKRHNLKTNFGIIKTFAITSSEILEDLVRIKWSKAIKTGFELFEKNSRLTSIESNAPGKEIGYIYDVEQKFKKK